MNFKTTILLLALLAVLAGFFYLARSAPSTRDREQQLAELAARGGRPLFADDQIDPQAVVRLTVRVGDDEPIVLEKQGEGWAQSQPVRFPISDSAAERLINTAASVMYVQRFAPGDGAPGLDELGLDPARAQLTIEEEHGRAHTLRLGRSAAGGRAYAMLDQAQAVYVVDDALSQELLEGGLDAWRTRTLSTPPVRRVDRVTLRRGDGRITLRREGDQWRFAPPHVGRVSPRAVTSLLGAVGGVYIDRFAQDRPADPAAFGLDRPRAVLEIHQSPAPGESSDGRRYTFTLGDSTDLSEAGYFATWAEGPGLGEVVFTVEKAMLEKLSQDVSDLRDPRVMVPSAEELTRVRIEQAGEALVLTRQAEGWAFGEPTPGFSLEPQAAAPLLKALAELEAQAFEPNPNPTDPSLATVHAETIGQSQPTVLRIYPAGENRRLVVREDESIGYLVEADSLAPLLAPAWTLRDRDVLSMKIDRIERITIEHPEGGRREAVRDGESWALADGQPIERSAVDALLARLAQLRAEAWLPTDSQLQNPTVVTIDIDGEPRTLRIGEGGAAELDGLDQPFRLSEADARALSGELRERSALPIDHADLRRVTIQRQTEAGEQTTLSIAKDAVGRLSAEGGQAIDPDAAGEVFEALVNLRVVRYLTDGAAVSQPTLKLTLETAEGGPITVARVGEGNVFVIARGDNAQRVRLDDDAAQALAAWPVEQATGE